MSTTEAVKAGGSVVKTKSKEKEKDRKQRSGQKSQSSMDRLKTVVRKLPPNLPEEIFWQSVQQWVTEETVAWKEYYQGKFKKRLNKENIPSRAYIAFKNQELLATFSREYDGHIFRDKAGNESIAVVEFAPFQKVPSGKTKVDSRMGTIEQDEDFISFLESLKEPQAKPFDADTLESLVADIQPSALPTTTPLLEALKAEKSAQRDKEAILRNHAHYKDANAASFNAPSKKEDGKKKAPPANNAAPKSSDAHMSKKAAKKAAAKAATQGPAPASIQQQSKDAPPANAPSKPKNAPPTPKGPRGNRERQGSKGAADAGKVSAASNSHNPPSAQPATTAQVAPSGDASIPASQPAAIAPRRGRPVVGLASRHFEAALSGAVGAKPRREKEPAPQTASAVTSPKTRPSQITTNAPPTILQRDTQGPQTLAGIIARPPATEDGTAGGGGRGHRGRSRGRGGRGRGS